MLILVLLSTVSIGQNLDSIPNAPVALPDTLIETPENNIQTPVDLGSVSIRLTEKEIEATKGELVSNNVFVKNTSGEAVNFYVDIALPGDWKFFGTDRMFTVAPDQEVVIPLRVLPTRLLGSTKFVVNILFFNEEEEQIGSEFFFIQSFKNVDWDVSLEQGNVIYFKNDQTKAKFDLSVLNKGNYDQDLILTMTGTRKDFVLRDTANKIIEQPKYSLSLKPMEDTSFTYEIETTREARNLRTISLQEHTPNTFLDDKTYSLYINTAESKLSGTNLSRKGQKVDFRKLSNTKEISDYPGPVLPLIVDANIQNVLTTNTFMNLVLRGFQSYKNGANLVYFNQFNFSTQYASSGILNNSSNYVGYFHPNFTAEAGNVAGVSFGMPAIGRGLKGSYRVYKNHWVGAYYVRQPRLFQPAQVENYGAYYQYQGTGRIRGNGGWARSEDFVRNRTANQVNGRVSFKIARSQTVTLLGAYSIRNSIDPITQQIVNRNGFIAGANYSGRFIDKKLSANIAGRYQNRTFGLADNEKRIMNSVIQYRTGRRSNVFFNSTMNENIFQLRNFDGTFSDVTNFLFYNLLGYSKGTDVGTFQYYGYYNVLSLQSKRIESPGLGIRYSNYLFDKSILWTSDIRAGYDKAQFLPDLPRYFVFRANSLVRWRTFNFVGGYFYGPNSPAAVENMVESNVNPVYLRIGLGHQYLFKNTHFVLQNNLNYTYQNQSNSHRIGYFPEVLYFTNDGWRFSANINYSLATRKFDQTFPQFGSVQNLENIGERTTGQNFQLGVSVRKEFGIPIPFTKQRNHNREFVAFFDLDGNSIRDKGEPYLDNVVIRLGQNEVITNAEGRATMKNIPGGDYGFVVFNLEKLDGWFPNIQDSIFVFEEGIEYIPFVKGVKIYGEVIVDRQAQTEKLNKALDLSDIKISAISTQKDYHTLTDGKGAFEFYLPNGIYTLSMDETILGSNYTLVRNNFDVKMENGVEGMHISFNIIEKRRAVKNKKFGSSSSPLRNLNNGDKPSPVKLPRRDTPKTDSSSTGGVDQSDRKTQLQNAASGQAPKGSKQDANTNGDGLNNSEQGGGTEAQNQQQGDNPATPKLKAGDKFELGEGQDANNSEVPSGTQNPNEPSNPNAQTENQNDNQQSPSGAGNQQNPNADDASSPIGSNEQDKADASKRFIEPPITAITGMDDTMNIKNPDPEKIKFVVNLGTFVDNVPSSVLNHIIEMGYSNQVVPGQDTLKFMSFPVSSEDEARELMYKAVNSGFGDPPPQMQGEYDGYQLSLEQTRILHNRARKNEEGE